MKVLAIVLLCAFAAVQGRSAVKVVGNNEVVELGDKPWIVHLRIAVANSGLLESGAGTLISSSWVLTEKSLLDLARFVWVRLGAVNSVNPSLVLETSAVRPSAQGSLGLVNLNRIVWATDNISPIPLNIDEAASSALVAGDAAEVCGYGANEAGEAGETLSCSAISISDSEDNKLIASSDSLTKFDLGTALVSDGKQVAVLVAVEDNTASFVTVASEKAWIEEVTGLEL